MLDDTTRTIITQYDAYDEDARLTGAFGELEKLRTQEMVARFLTRPSMTILDVGGATGAYAFWLAGLGHAVTLIDIVPKHIEIARQRLRAPGSTLPVAGEPVWSPALPGKVHAEVGDARALEVADGVADLVLMHGPLYHLVERADRIRALAEAWRVLHPGGVLLAFTITRYAGINYAISKGLVFDDAYYRVMDHEVRTGHCDNDPPVVNTFRQAFFHLPDEIRGEIVEAGLAHEATLGVMGTAWMVPDLETCWTDEAKRARVLDVARLLENEPALGPRMMTVARKAR